MTVEFAYIDQNPVVCHLCHGSDEIFHDKFGVKIQSLVQERLNHQLQSIQNIIVQFAEFGVKQDEFNVVLPAITSSFAHLFF